MWIALLGCTTITGTLSIQIHQTRKYSIIIKRQRLEIPLIHIYRCQNYCNGEGYSYFGLQYRKHCFCGHALPAIEFLTDDSDCNMPCDGDPNVMCGGAWRMNVYEIIGKLHLKHLCI